MTTAINLANRLRRRFREEDVTALGDDLTNFCIDLLNEAKRDILESYTWEFDKRSDGELLTMAALSNVTVNVTNGNLSVLSTLTASQVTRSGSYPVTKIVVTSDANFGDTALRVGSFTPGAVSTMTLANVFPGTSNASATATVVFDEYVLPDNIRAITSVRHQQQDLQVIEVDRDVGLDAWAPRPHGDLGDSPERVFIGKYATATYDVTDDSTINNGISIKFDHTPNAALLMNYSYVIRHPDIGDGVDLDGVDQVVEDLIVRLAEARGTMSGLGSDIQTGAAMETEVLNRCAAIHGNSRRDPLRRVILGPTFGGRGVSYGFGRLPRRYGSL